MTSVVSLEECFLCSLLRLFIYVSIKPDFFFEVAR